MAGVHRSDCAHAKDHSLLCDCGLTGPKREAVDHPMHYGGDTTYEAIKVIEAWDLGFCLGNTVKYISRAGKKPSASKLEDLKKARWYLDREIQRFETSK